MATTRSKERRRRRRKPWLLCPQKQKLRTEHRCYDQSEYEPFWAAAEALDVPLSLHTATRRQGKIRGAGDKTLRDASVVVPEVRYINRAVLSKAFLPSPLMGEGLGGGEPVKIFGDYRVHAFGIVQNLVVPEPQDTVPLAFQELSAARPLLRREIMLAAIDLDDQRYRVTDEVGNEPADRHLTAKSVPFGLPQSQHFPEPFLGFGHLAAEYAGAPVGSLARLLLHH